MDHDELLRRLDAHMERGNNIMARSNEGMARNEIAFGDLRSFLAEQTLALRALTREVLGMSRRTDEVIDEMRAQRQALFRMLDRLDGRGGEAAG